MNTIFVAKGIIRNRTTNQAKSPKTQIFANPITMECIVYVCCILLLIISYVSRWTGCMTTLTAQHPPDQLCWDLPVQGINSFSPGNYGQEGVFSAYWKPILFILSRINDDY